LEQLCAIENSAWDFTSTCPNFTTCTDEFLFEEYLSNVKGNANDNLYKKIPIEEIIIEKLDNHSMNEVWKMKHQCKCSIWCCRNNNRSY
jgi:hypothetical protein